MALQGPEELGEQLEEPEDLDDQDASSISPAEEITLPSGLGGDDEAEEALLLPWDRFSAWLHCICVVGFDLELGQAVEVRGRTWLCKTPPHLAENAQVSSSSGRIRLFRFPKQAERIENRHTGPVTYASGLLVILTFLFYFPLW